MRIAIFGTGGVGGYFGGRLAQAGEDVTFIARGSHLQAMQADGLRVDSLRGDFVVQPIQATDDPAQIGPVDAVILGVKAWQVPETARALHPLIGPETVVVPLQNGVEAPAHLAAELGAQPVLGGFCRVISYIVEPGHIREAGGNPYVAFGELDNRPSQRTERLRQIFDKAQGLTAEILPDIQAGMWRKFLLIASWSGVGAITRAPLGVWRSLPGTRQMCRRAMGEVVAVAQARDVNLPEESVEQAMAYVESLPDQATASMQRDIMAGRPSELDSQCGAVVRLGREVDISTPTHSFLYHSLLPQEKKARGEVEFP